CTTGGDPGGFVYW
nr:immunoglobulin heavy chain junction region [Mus musculus]MBK4198491.1 immunoglobulin heavy chain junction region [Mus musculus]